MCTIQFTAKGDNIGGSHGWWSVTFDNDSDQCAMQINLDEPSKAAAIGGLTWRYERESCDVSAAA
jgi:hypothetical protein